MKTKLREYITRLTKFRNNLPKGDERILATAIIEDLIIFLKSKKVVLIVFIILLILMFVLVVMGWRFGRGVVGNGCCMV